MKKINITKEQVINGIKFVGLIALASAGTIAKNSLQNSADYKLNQKRYANADYTDAIEAVMNSDMWSSDKRQIIDTIPRNGDTSLYSGIIAIAKGNSLWSSDRRHSIIKMCEETVVDSQ